MAIGQAPGLRARSAVIAASALIPLTFVCTDLCGDVTDFAFDVPEVLELPEGSSPSCLALSDLDKDGDLDGVLSGRNVDGNIVLLDGTPNGEFVVSGQLVAPDQTDWVVIADLNKDGAEDIVFAMRMQAGAIGVFDGILGGGFNEEPRVISVGREIRCLEVVDIDGNDTLDVVAIGHRTEDVSVLLGDGKGGLEIYARTRLSPWKNGYVYPQSCMVLDLDGDDVLDVASVSIGARGLSLIRTDGNGQLKAARSWEPPDVDGEAGGCAYASAVDFDGDGLLEFVLPQTTWGQQWFVVFELDSNGDVDVQRTRALPGSTMGISWIPAAADFDSDGDSDLVIGHALPGIIAFMENVGEPDGPAIFLEPQWFLAGGFIRNLNVVDLDGDGDQDLLALDFTGDSIFIFRNGLNEGFASGASSQEPVTFDLPEHIRSLDGPALTRWLSDVEPEVLRGFMREPKVTMQRVRQEQ